MPGYLQLKKVMLSQLAALWMTTAMAAEATFAHDITSIPLAAISVAMALAFIGGLAFTTQKIAKPDIIIPNVPLEVFKDLVNSLVAGLCAFFLASWVGATVVPPFAQALIITVAGYGGSRFLEQLLVETFTRIGTLINGAGRKE